MKRPLVLAALTVAVLWGALLYLVPIAVGYAVGATPLRLMSSGILFEQSEVSLAGYRLILWSPVVVGAALMVFALRRAPAVVPVTAGIVGTTFAATLLTLGGVLGIGMGGLLLVGTDIRWIWKLCLGFGGVALGLAGTQLIKARAEDHDLPWTQLKRGILLGGALVGVGILLLAP